MSGQERGNESENKELKIDELVVDSRLVPASFGWQIGWQHRASQEIDQTNKQINEKIKN